jgi:hypothetical protein
LKAIRVVFLIFQVAGHIPPFLPEFIVRPVVFGKEKSPFAFGQIESRGIASAEGGMNIQRRFGRVALLAAQAQ